MAAAADVAQYRGGGGGDGRRRQQQGRLNEEAGEEQGIMTVLTDKLSSLKPHLSPSPSLSASRRSVRWSEEEAGEDQGGEGGAFGLRAVPARPELSPLDSTDLHVPVGFYAVGNGEDSASHVKRL